MAYSGDLRLNLVLNVQLGVFESETWLYGISKSVNAGVTAPDILRIIMSAEYASLVLRSSSGLDAADQGFQFCAKFKFRTFGGFGGVSD